MTTPRPLSATTINAALRTITPSWPLDQAVAVNPHWRRIEQPVEDVAARLGLLGGFHVFPAHDDIASCWQSGRITKADLQQALDNSPYHHTISDCIKALHTDDRPIMPLVVDLLSDTLKDGHHLPWRDAITFQLGQICGAYFDKDQGHWLPQAHHGLYAFWYATLWHDRGSGTVMGLRHLHRQLKNVPTNADDAIQWAATQLGDLGDNWQAYLEALLLTVNGWASWCTWLDDQTQDAATSQHLYDLLAMRLVWEALLLACHPEQQSGTLSQLHLGWQQLPDRLADAKHSIAFDAIWQTALEIGFQRQLATKLNATDGKATPAPAAQDVQMIFCIDTRSEIIRRALETVDPRIKTGGTAGNFSLPMSYRPWQTAIKRPQLPGLAKPSIEATDIHDKRAAKDNRRRRLASRQQWQTTVDWPNATFSFVEAVGFGYLPRLWRWLLPSRRARRNADHAGVGRQRHRLRPQLVGLSLADKTALAHNALEVMGLNHSAAPLVILCGHASQTTNNAHASTLDCGACGGQSGEANVRALAALLNDDEVRQALAADGLDITASTFLPALHNTTTDEITGFDVDRLPDTQQAHWQQLQTTLKAAGDRARRERAPTLWMDNRGDADILLRQFRRRANNGAETRPEWGLTGNAGFIIGPRSLTQQQPFSRCYLHDYDASTDNDFTLLDRLMTGPLLVTHWLNWQYHASTSDPQHYGAGNKVLHNVVGGRIGVFEGNGGDLRIGLPKQSLFDEQGWRHEPLRQTTVIAAPRRAIEACIARHDVLQQLFNNSWMTLWQYENGQLWRYQQGEWNSV